MTPLHRRWFKWSTFMMLPNQVCNYSTPLATVSVVQRSVCGISPFASFCFVLLKLVAILDVRHSELLVLQQSQPTCLWFINRTSVIGMRRWKRTHNFIKFLCQLVLQDNIACASVQDKKRWSLLAKIFFDWSTFKPSRVPLPVGSSNTTVVSAVIVGYHVCLHSEIAPNI